MSAAISYKILNGIFPVSVTVTNVDSDPPVVLPVVTHNTPGTYEYSGLSENINYSIRFDDSNDCMIEYSKLKKSSV